jgi:protein ImuB
VLQATDAAQAQGVRAGQTLSAAQALCAELLTRERDAAREQAALEGAAHWAGRFSPQLVLLQASVKPAALLMEIGHSLRLFGGLNALCARMTQGLADTGLQSRLGVAPTPQGALLLARAPFAAQDCIAPDMANFKARFVRLPVQLLDAASGCTETLASLGMRVMADLLALPRAGLTRRFGATLIDEMDRALGAAPDPRRPWVWPETFASSMELPYAVSAEEHLREACSRLFNELEGFLSARRAGVRHLQIIFRQERKQVAALDLRLIEPAREAAHLDKLLRERLKRAPVSAPVTHMSVAATQLDYPPEAPFDLLAHQPGKSVKQGGSLAQLIERLSARMGDEAVRRVLAVPEHRPECATQTPAFALAEANLRAPGLASTMQKAQSAQTAQNAPQAPRPLWLLNEPKPLTEISAKPQFEGPLKLLSGPERIESGWWDTAQSTGVARDYFIATNPKKSILWVFRERKEPGGWYLHGLFA